MQRGGELYFIVALLSALSKGSITIISESAFLMLEREQSVCFVTFGDELERNAVLLKKQDAFEFKMQICK